MTYTTTALCIASSLTSLVGLTIIVPDGERHLSNIGDDIMAAPLGTITTLILGGCMCVHIVIEPHTDPALRRGML